MKKFNSRFVKLFIGALFGLLLVVGLSIKPGWANLGGATDVAHVNQSHHSLNYVSNYVKMGNPLYAQAESNPDESGVEEQIVPQCTDGVYYLPNPYDCKSFYQCSNGRPILMPCAEGTEWDDTLQVCNWPEEAQCTELVPN